MVKRWAIGNGSPFCSLQCTATFMVRDASVSDHGPFVQTLWPVDAVPRRLVRRDYPFHQSGDKIHMHRSGWKLTELRQIAMLDWFHVLIEWSLGGLLALTVAMYTLLVLLFGLLYMAIDRRGEDCGLAPPGQDLSWQTAIAFSVETFSTIGYGVPFDSTAFFDNCMVLTVAVYSQALTFILLNATLLGIIFARVGRASTRAAQVLFSDKATIRCVRGRFYFSFQVGEASFLQYHPIVEAHVRAYAVLHERVCSTSRALIHRNTQWTNELMNPLILGAARAASHDTRFRRRRHFSEDPLLALPRAILPPVLREYSRPSAGPRLSEARGRPLPDSFSPNLPKSPQISPNLPMSPPLGARPPSSRLASCG